ncbi:MAG: RNA methyltransferase [Spirochaetales bacterium]|nr:RNA methyltransferase [Spirochaetales bacterium]
MSEWLKSVRVVLCRPEGPLNVGAVCRAMKSMGLTRLVLVSPGDFAQEEVHRMAVHAKELYDQAEHFENLDEALAGTVLSAGITRRRGSRRKWFSVLPEELAQQCHQLEGEAALVFGNERTGLSDDELNCCTMACHIPTSPDFPSLNLSHAVQVVTAAFYRESIGERTGTYAPVTREEVDQLVTKIHSGLDSRDYFRNADPEHTDRFFRDILSRAALSVREARQIEKILAKLPYLSSSDPS